MRNIHTQENTMTAHKDIVARLSAILEGSEREHAATALSNIDALAELAAKVVMKDEDGKPVTMQPFIEGYLNYIKDGTSSQLALDALKRSKRPVYDKVRPAIVKTAGVTRLSSGKSGIVTDALADALDAMFS